MRAKAGEMPESLVLGIGNSPGVSDGRFGFDSFFQDCKKFQTAAGQPMAAFDSVSPKKDECNA